MCNLVRLVMDSSVDLNGQLGGGAVEVENIGPDRMLAAKLELAHLIAA